MTGPAGFDVVLSAVEGAAGPLSDAETEMQTAGTSAETGSSTASGASGDGPLGGALVDLGSTAQMRAESVGEECHALARALHDTVDDYRQLDTAAQTGISAVSFGNVTG